MRRSCASSKCASEVSINRLARDIAVPRARISAIVNGKSAITADTALRVAKYFGVSSELWLGLQTDYELRMARRRVGQEIERRVHARVA
jgi:addiction module HigA family antidote